LFRQRSRDETILPSGETISSFGADIRKQQMVIKPTTERRIAPTAKPRDCQMQTLSFILVLAFMLVCPALGGGSEPSLPGIGTFAYSGSPVAAPYAVLVAAR
jgi:hypothetical protein